MGAFDLCQARIEATANRGPVANPAPCAIDPNKYGPLPRALGMPGWVPIQVYLPLVLEAILGAQVADDQ
jgi:hypothetical protein